MKGIRFIMDCQVEQRNVIMCIVWSILTLGLYDIYWIYALTNDINEMSEEEGRTSGGMVILLTIVTFGLYAIYWAYAQGEALGAIKQKNGDGSGSNGTLYLILAIFGMGWLNPILIQNEVNNALAK